MTVPRLPPRLEPGAAVAFIGLGVMGRPMAENLLRAGYRVTVFNRSPEPLAQLVAAGARAGAGPAECSAQSQVTVTMLPDADTVERVVLGPGGVRDGAAPSHLLVDMSSISPRVTRHLSETLGRDGVWMLDAPVSGGESGAIAASLSIMVGGEAEVVEAARPLLGTLGSRIVHVGPAGAGQVAKAANQVVVALGIQAVAEALNLASRAGVDPAAVRDALLGGFAGSQVLQLHGERMLEGDFRPGARLALHLKDLETALELGLEVEAALPATRLIRELMQQLAVAGRDHLDHAALSLLVRELSGPAAPACCDSREDDLT